MEATPQGPKAVTGGELKAQIEAEREGRPFLVYRSADGEQRILLVEEGRRELWIGRADSADITLDWDREVSKLHAQLELIGDEATLVDDGLSTNGSYVNEERVSGRCRLNDGDIVRVGRTGILFRAPGAVQESTVIASDAISAAGVSPAQKRVLVALCRPFKDGAAFASPLSNQEIAEELHLSVDAIKTHLRALFEKFELGDVPQQQKRVQLVQRAMQSGLITPRDL
ncbi:MAG TPA: FHA domain-containing protein [Solirubrobacterales bacterium]|nr:FHA domain-containing protein [Solirubrobacterales bacterium]